MVRVKDGQLFNYEQFKKDFRRAAEAKGIDPEKGLTDVQHAMSKPSSFQIALENAAIRTRFHSIHQVVAFNVHMKRHPFQFALDEERKSAMRNPQWWKLLDADDWKSGGDGSVVERQAFAAIRRDIRAKDNAPEHRKPDMAEAVDAMNEVFDEMHSESPAQISPKQIKAIARVSVPT